MYNLTESQKNLLRWFVEQVKSGNLSEQFHVVWINTPEKFVISELKKKPANSPQITEGALDALVKNELLLQEKSPPINIRCTLTGRAKEAVDSDFAAPDTSFIKHLTPLADITNLDRELKERCLPILGAGSADPKLWDSAVRTACVILEDRVRQVGGISDRRTIGTDLVNKVFGDKGKGTLASKFPVDSERQGYRDLYAGVVGTFRNPYGHRFVDPSPEEGGAIITFVNLLLKMLEDLRPHS
jgi:Protein of unknown function (Hypoth_ymh)